MILAADAIRILALVLAFTALALMVLINLVASRVLTTRNQAPFLWRHVATVSGSTILMTFVAAESMFQHFGNPPTWRLPLFLAAVVLLVISLHLVYKIERGRLVEVRAAQMAADDDT